MEREGIISLPIGTIEDRRTDPVLRRLAGDMASYLTGASDRKGDQNELRTYALRSIQERIDQLPAGEHQDAAHEVLTIVTEWMIAKNDPSLDLQDPVAFAARDTVNEALQHGLFADHGYPLNRP